MQEVCDSNVPFRGAENAASGPVAEVDFYGEPAEPAPEQPEADADPAITAHEEREEDEAPAADAGAADAASSEAASPAPGDGTDQDPPLDTPGVAAGESGQPDRGRALQQVMDYADVSRHEIHTRLEGTLMADLGSALEIDRLQREEGMSREDAVDQLAFRGPLEDQLGPQVVQSELDHAQLQYGNALDAAGLELATSQDGTDIGARVRDADAFTAALEATPMPEDPAAQERLRKQATWAVEGALQSISTTIVMWLPGARAIMTGRVPDEMDDTRVDSSEISDTQAQLADSLPGNAETIAAELERLGAPNHILTETRQLATAYREGRTTAWAVGYDLSVIGDTEHMVGVDRLTDPQSWSEATAYLTALWAETGPDSEFAEQVFNSVLRDIDKALAGEDPTASIPPSDLREGIPADVYIGRQWMAAEAAEMLRAAREDIERIRSLR